MTLYLRALARVVWREVAPLAKWAGRLAVWLMPLGAIMASGPPSLGRLGLLVVWGFLVPTVWVWYRNIGHGLVTAEAELIATERTTLTEQGGELMLVEEPSPVAELWGLRLGPGERLAYQRAVETGAELHIKNVDRMVEEYSSGKVTTYELTDEQRRALGYPPKAKVSKRYSGRSCP